MDSATRSFLSLVGSAMALAAYAVCGFIAYVFIPVLGLDPGELARLGLACLLPALILAALVGVSVGLSSRRLARLLLASRRLSRSVEVQALSATPELLAAAQASGLDGRVTMVDSSERFSFVYGVLVPRVAISRGFVETLTAAELRATLEHERYHVRHLDPLRAVLVKTLSEAFFLLPSFEVLRLRYEAGRELAADACAERACGRRPLLGALLKALKGPGGEPVVSAPLAGQSFLDARVARLETGRSPRLPVDRNWIASTLGTAAFALLFVAAVAGIGGPTALAGIATDELNPGGILLGALCLLPIVGAAALAYWHLSRRAGEPLSSGGSVPPIHRRYDSPL